MKTKIFIQLFLVVTLLAGCDDGNNFVEIVPVDDVDTTSTVTPNPGDGIEYEHVDISINNYGKSVTFRMIGVEPGTFAMGSSEYSDSQPIHAVTLTDKYYMGETEVTQSLWFAVMGAISTASSDTGEGDLFPVYSYSYDTYLEFIGKLNELTEGKRPTGRHFRLPTEAEWEFAARGGNKSRGYIYAGSDNCPDVAVWDVSSSWPVKSKAPNELGLYDMSGNVAEYCSDWYYAKYPSSAQTNPAGPDSGTYRVTRGGSFGRYVSYPYTTTIRNYNTSYTGIRLVLAPKKD